MKDSGLEKLIKMVDSAVVPPEGLKEKLLTQVLASEDETNLMITPFERFLFEKPLRAASCISILISGLLWVVMGSGFEKLFISMIG
jgi:hypothetical protein